MWHDYCFIAGNFKIMNIPNKTFLVLMIGAASLAVFGPMASANTMQLTLDYGNRHSGDGGEFNASSADFAPLAMGYDAAGPTTQAPPTQASKPSAWNTMSISTPARATITESAKKPSMAAFLEAILIPFQGNGVALPELRYTQPSGIQLLPGAGGNASAADLQATIWFLEGEGGANINLSQLVMTTLGQATRLDNNGITVLAF